MSVLQREQPEVYKGLRMTLDQLARTVLKSIIDQVKGNGTSNIDARINDTTFRLVIEIKAGELTLEDIRSETDEVLQKLDLNFRKMLKARDILEAFPKEPSADDLIDLWKMNKRLHSKLIASHLTKASISRD